MKFLNWLSKLLLSAVLISGISIYTTWYTVQTIMEDVLRKFHLEPAASELNLADWLTRLAQQTGLIQKGITSTDSKVGLGSKDPSVDNFSVVPSTSGSISAEAGAGNDPFVQEAVPVWGQTNRAESRSGGADSVTGSVQERVVMSAEEFNRKRDKLSGEDKMKVFSLLISRLPQEDVQSISSLVENGITGEELAQVEEIVRKRLQPEEYEQLLKILKKY